MLGSKFCLLEQEVLLVVAKVLPTWEEVLTVSGECRMALFVKALCANLLLEVLGQVHLV